MRGPVRGVRPEHLVERAAGRVQVPQRPTVGDRRLDLGAVAHDAGVGHEPGHVVVAERGDDLGVEVGERRPERGPLAQDRDPGEPGLERLEREPLVQGVLAVHRPAPLLVVVLLVDGVAVAEAAAGARGRRTRSCAESAARPPTRRTRAVGAGADASLGLWAASGGERDEALDPVEDEHGPEVELVLVGERRPGRRTRPARRPAAGPGAPPVTRACVISSPRSGAGAPSAVAPTAAVRPAPLSSSPTRSRSSVCEASRPIAPTFCVLGQRGAVQRGEHRLHPGEPSRPDGVQHLGRAGEPRVRVQDRLLDREDELEPLAPAADLGADDGGPPGRAVGHEAQHLVLGRDVAVQRHRGEPERLGEPGHRHALDPLGVGQGDARVGDLLEREARSGAGPAGRRGAPEHGDARRQVRPGTRVRAGAPGPRAGGPSRPPGRPAAGRARRRAGPSPPRAADARPRGRRLLARARSCSLRSPLAPRLRGVLLGPEPVALAALGVLLGVPLGLLEVAAGALGLLGLGALGLLPVASQQLGLAARLLGLARGSVSCLVVVHGTSLTR